MGEELLLLNPFARIWFLEVRNWAVAFYRSIAVFAFGFFIFIFNSRVLSAFGYTLTALHYIISPKLILFHVRH